jgi:hypothetical protein
MRLKENNTNTASTNNMVITPKDACCRLYALYETAAAKKLRETSSSPISRLRYSKIIEIQKAEVK